MGAVVGVVLAKNKTCQYCLETSFDGLGYEVAHKSVANPGDAVNCSTPEKRVCNAAKGEDTCGTRLLQFKVTGKQGETTLNFDYNMTVQGCMESNVTCKSFESMGETKMGQMSMSLVDCQMSSTGGVFTLYIVGVLIVTSLISLL